MEQTREKIFDRIVLGLVVVGLVGSAVALSLTGIWSIWFLSAIILLVTALFAYAIRSSHQFVFAAYLLVEMLVGLVTGLFRQSSPTSDFIPYLFIPIVIIAGAVLPPLAPIITAVISVCLALGVLLLTQQFTMARLGPLLPPLGLTVLVALLMAESGRQADKLSRRLKESNQLLQERSWETLEALNEAKELKQRVAQLEYQLQQAQAEADRQNHLPPPANGLVRLVEGAVEELNTAVKQLSRTVEKVETLPNLDQQPGLMEELWKKIDRLTGLIVGLEEMAQLERDEVALDLQQVDMAQLIREVVGIARGLARAKNLELNVFVSDDLPLLNVDPDRMRQALLPVLTNAVQYTDAGLVDVSAKLTSQELIIQISDTGIGLDPSETEKIFQKFGRSSHPLAQRRQGSGLGLALSDRLVKLHGGRIWVSSQSNQGSTFYLSLPLSLALADTPVPAESPTLVSLRPLPEPQPAVATLPAEPEVTLISRKPETGSAPARDNLGPVARFGPTYSSRFSSTLLALLLLVACSIGSVALISRSFLDSRPKASHSPTPAGVAQVSSQPQAELKRTATPTARPTDTPRPQPTDTPALLLPTATPPVTATATSTPAESLPLTSTPTVTVTPTPSPTLEAAPVETEVVPAAVVLPSPTPLAQQLSFIVDSPGDRFVLLTSLVSGATAGEQAVAVAPLGDGGQSWSPSGQLVFTSDRAGDRDLYLADLAGGQLQRLTDAVGDDTQPAWSPDGRYLAFSSNRTGNFEIYMMRADGSQPVQLTTSRGFDEWPVWSPDGRRIAFVSDRDGNEELYVMNADGRDQQRLTNHPADDWPASWSPDGRLVFASNRDGNWNLYLINADGAGLSRLTDAPGNERNPAWSPDGRRIAFASDRNGNWDIYTLALPAGPGVVPASDWTQITSTPSDERFPAWLP